MQIKLANIEAQVHSTIFALATTASAMLSNTNDCVTVHFNEVSVQHVCTFALITHESVSTATWEETNRYAPVMILAIYVKSVRPLVVYSRGLAESIMLKLSDFNKFKGTLVFIGLRCERVHPRGLKVLSSRALAACYCSKELTCAITFRRTCRALLIKNDRIANLRNAKFAKFTLNHCTQMQVSENRLLKFSLTSSAIRCLEVSN